MDIYTLTNAGGLTLKVTPYGATVTELHVPDARGELADVVLGFQNVADYERSGAYLGATVGRVANRIRDARFNLEGQEYRLAANDGKHHLHGGNKGWNRVIWTGERCDSPDGPAVRLTYVSADGEEGYPGNVTATTIYRLTNTNQFIVEMEAVTDRTTLVNMAHHAYWNLGGYGSGPITDHELTLFAAHYTPGDPMVPVGVTESVHGTPFDFTTTKRVGRDLAATGGDPVGFDHNFVINGDAHALRPVARLRDPKSGRGFILEANQPGVQFYSGNFLDGKSKGKGAVYCQHAGLCLETQAFPNSINVDGWKHQVLLRPGQVYKHIMVHRFTAD